MHVLITGGCGFIGSNLAARLARTPDVRLRILDNESMGKRAHLDGFQGEFIRGDLQNRDTLDAAVQGVDAVVHLAADTRVMDSIAAPQFNYDVNVQGSFNLLEAMREAGVKRLVNASTGGAILGEAPPPINEDMVAQPMAPYGAAKLAVEGYCSAYAASYGFKALSLRFSNVYGPRSYHKGSVVAAFIKRIMAGQTLVIHGDGTQVRDYVYVDDLCDGIIAGLTGDVSGVVQLGSGRPVTLNALTEAMAEVIAPVSFEVDRQAFRDGEIRETWCDIGKARRVLGFDPATSLNEGLHRTWQWFQQQRPALAA